MDKGKKPMTEAAEVAERRAKQPAPPTSKEHLTQEELDPPTSEERLTQEELEHYDPIYKGPASSTSRPPFVPEPKNVANIVGDPVS
ncbi:hypothetical protein ACHQM5_003169 [Ranunculus cassubicifolius]